MKPPLMNLDKFNQPVPAITFPFPSFNPIKKHGGEF